MKKINKIKHFLVKLKNTFLELRPIRLKIIKKKAIQILIAL